MKGKDVIEGVCDVRALHIQSSNNLNVVGELLPLIPCKSSVLSFVNMDFEDEPSVSSSHTNVSYTGSGKIKTSSSTLISSLIPSPVFVPLSPASLAPGIVTSPVNSAAPTSSWALLRQSSQTYFGPFLLHFLC